MKKTVSIIVFLIALYVMPLLGKPQLLTHFSVLYAAVVCALLLGTQPVMSARESRSNQKTDKGTMWLILLVSAGGQVVSIVDWAYFQSFYWEKELWGQIGFAEKDSWGRIGMLLSLKMTISGLALRIWAIQTLQSAFSTTVTIKEDQQLITSGPYQWLRHPSYTGAWMVMIGVALLFNSLIGLLFMGPGMFIIYGMRISTEEKTLREAFGEKYIQYASRTKKLLPFIY